jgi:endonuclease/exonuclease/phosphatase (EEP) superfamily protein YafD
VLALLLRERAVAAVAAVVALALVGVVAPRALGGPGDANAGAGGRPLGAMTFNLRYGGADPEAVVDLVRRRGVDVLALQELTPEAVERLDAAGLRELLPGRVLDARPGAAGSGLYARGRLRQTGPGTARLGALELQVIHPPPPISPGATRIWQAGLRGVPGPGGATRLVLGDFNGTLDNRELRRVLDRGYVDAADAAGAGLRWTYPAGRRALTRITIDHVLVARDVAVREVSVVGIRGSDHRAVLARLRLPQPGQ